MAGLLAGHAEVVDRPHQAGAEQVMPDAVDENASCQRMVRVSQPPSEFQSAALVFRRAGRGERNNFREGPVDLLSRAADLAAFQQRHIDDVLAIEDSYRQRQRGSGFADLFQLTFDRAGPPEDPQRVTQRENALGTFALGDRFPHGGSTGFLFGFQSGQVGFQFLDTFGRDASMQNRHALDFRQQQRVAADSIGRRDGGAEVGFRAGEMPASA